MVVFPVLEAELWRFCMVTRSQILANWSASPIANVLLIGRTDHVDLLADAYEHSSRWKQLGEAFGRAAAVETARMGRTAQAFVTQYRMKGAMRRFLEPVCESCDGDRRIPGQIGRKNDFLSDERMVPWRNES